MSRTEQAESIQPRGWRAEREQVGENVEEKEPRAQQGQTRNSSIQTFHFQHGFTFTVCVRFSLNFKLNSKAWVPFSLNLKLNDKKARWGDRATWDRTPCTRCQMKWGWMGADRAPEEICIQYSGQVSACLLWTFCQPPLDTPSWHELDKRGKWRRVLRERCARTQKHQVQVSEMEMSKWITSNYHVSIIRPTVTDESGENW